MLELNFTTGLNLLQNARHHHAGRAYKICDLLMRQLDNITALTLSPAFQKVQNPFLQIGGANTFERTNQCIED